MAIEYMCECGRTFTRYNSLNRLCGLCAFNKYGNKKRKPLKRVGKVTKKWIEVRHEWIKKHTTASGTWECYLQIHPDCPRILTIDTLTLDHVIPRSGDPSKRYDENNLRPACWPCNGMKGSKRLGSSLGNLRRTER